MRRRIMVGGPAGPAMAALVALAITGIAGGCAGHAGAAPGAPAEESVRIQVGKETSFADGALRIRFESVVSDSRCPKGETCVWEGDAIVVLAVHATEKSPANFELHTAARGPSAAGYEGWAIRLEALEPYPASGRVIQGAEYVATLSVSLGGEVDLATQ